MNNRKSYEFYLIFYTGRSEAVQLWLDMGIDPNMTDKVPIIYLLYNKLILKILIILKQKGKTALYHAMLPDRYHPTKGGNSLLCVKILLAAGADANSVEDDFKQNKNKKHILEEVQDLIEVFFIIYILCCFFLLF